MPAISWLCNSTRSEEHTSELQSLMRNSYAVFCLKKKKNKYQNKLHPRTKNILNHNNHLKPNLIHKSLQHVNIDITAPNQRILSTHNDNRTSNNTLMIS